MKTTWIDHIPLPRVRNYIFSKLLLLPIKTITRNTVSLDVSQLSANMRYQISIGEYELPESALCKRHLLRDDRVLEIGSAIGFVSICCRKMVGITSICCVEPNPRTIKILKANYQLNGLEPDLIEGCLAPNDGKFRLTHSEDFWVDRIDMSGTESVEHFEVPGYSLATLLSKTTFKPNVLIIDVEGT